MNCSPALRRLHLFFALSWVTMSLHLAWMTDAHFTAGWAAALWTLATTVSYAAIYLLPAWLISRIVLWAAGGRAPAPAGRSSGALLAVTMIGSTGITHVLLFADRVIYGMYGFHINGFVIDLVLTPGGIASLGASLSTQLTATAIVIALFALQAGVYFVLTSRFGSWMQRAGTFRWRWLILALIGLSVVERVAFAYSSAANFRPILFASQSVPLYLPLSARKLAARLGIAERADERVTVHAGSLTYPLKPLTVVPPERPLNVVWLVAESLRFDMLDPAIMPRLWDFSQSALRLENHYSGGNLTQMGVFSMFYGLFSNYWFPMADNRRSPLVMDVMQQQNYQFGLYTSQRFTYPAFDKTVFVRMNPADMHERDGGAEPWQRDRINIGELLDFIDRREPSRPFMTYMFFESTHANYTFPEETAIARPYLEDLNYLTADFKGDIGKIKNRYINASNHVDQQIGRVIDHLREKQLLDRTIVIVLGDHGEEFMERSRWGHSAEFNRFQTGTPAVVYVPGQSPRVVTGITSHLDIPATLMPLLGVQNPPTDYSFGKNLLAPDYHRDYAVAGDWNRLAYIGGSVKASFPINATGALRNDVTDGDDRPVADEAAAKAGIRTEMAEMLSNLSRFNGGKK